MATIPGNNSWSAGSITGSYSKSGRTAKVTGNMRVWRSDGGRSYNVDASNNFWINIGGQKYYHTVKEISGTTGVSFSNSRNYSLPNDGSNLSVKITAGGSIPGTTFGLGTGSTTVTVPGERATYTVSYNANGGTGAPGNQTKQYGINLTLSSVKPTRSGFLFMGWATSAGSTTATYQPGGIYTANAAITLYAVWIVADLITFDIPNKSYSVKSDTKGKVTESSLSSLKLGFTVNYTDDNYNINFYYRLMDSTKSIVETYGPFTAKGITEGTITSEESKQIIPTPEQILSSLKNYRDVSETIFYLDICTGDNKFLKEQTTSRSVTVDLTDFCYLKFMNDYGLYRNSNGTVHLNFNVKYPPSYGTITPEVKYSIDGSSTYNTISVTSKGSGIYYGNINISVDTTKSHIINIISTDNISEINTRLRVNSVNNENIEIRKTYDSLSNCCVCTEFIETDDGTVKFSKGGRVFSTEFIESKDVISIGQRMYFENLIEK